MISTEASYYDEAGWNCVEILDIWATRQSVAQNFPFRAWGFLQYGIPWSIWVYLYLPCVSTITSLCFYTNTTQRNVYVHTHIYMYISIYTRHVFESHFVRLHHALQHPNRWPLKTAPGSATKAPGDKHPCNLSQAGTRPENSPQRNLGIFATGWSEFKD